jgi:hypothetical protein
MIKLSTILKEFQMPSNKWVDYNLTDIDREGGSEIWDMYTGSYLKRGMDLSANSWSEMQSKYKAVALKDVDNDAQPDAFIIYRPTKAGNKIALLGTNDKPAAKKDVIKKVISLVNTSGWFLEASLKMEEIMKASGAPVVKDENKIKAIVGDKDVEMMGDGYYTRRLSKVNKKIVKRMYGKPR